MQKKKRKYRFLRRILRVFGVLILLFFALILFIRSPWGQNIIISKATDYVAKKTGTKVEIEKLFITFSGNVFIKGLYLEDKKGDTLVYSKSLEANLPISPILFQNSFHLKSLEWDGLIANISRNADSENYNFNFLIDAFVSEDSTTKMDSTAQSKPLKLDVGTLDFTDFKIDFNDQYAGLQAKLDLGVLLLSLDKMDLEAMIFEVDELELGNTSITYTQSKPSISEDTTATKLPFFKINDLKFNDVVAQYTSVPDGVYTKLYLQDFVLKDAKADVSKNDYELDLLALENSNIVLKLQNKVEEDSLSIDNDKNFTWPDFLVKADQINFKNNIISYISSDKLLQKNEFNPENIQLNNFDFSAKNLQYMPEKANLEVQALAFTEQSGFRIKNLSFDASFNETSASVLKLNFQTNSSQLNGNLKLQYDSVAKLIHAAEKTRVNAELSNFNVWLKDALYFQPTLKNNDYFSKISDKKFSGNLKAKGTLQYLNLPDFKIKWGENTSLIAEGILKNLTVTDSLAFDFRKIEAKTNKASLLKFISESDLGISIPENLQITATAKGTLNDIIADAQVKTPEGKINIDGHYKNTTSIAFNGKVAVDSLQLGKILKNEQIGFVDFSLDFDGKVSNLNTLNATLKADFYLLEYNNYDFSNLKLDGKMVNGKGEVNANFKDDNLNLTSTATIVLDSVATDVQLKANIIGADLYNLGITEENIKVALKVAAVLENTADNFKLNAEITDGIAVYNDEQYRLSDINITSKINSFSTQASIKSSFINGDLNANASPETINNAFKKQLKNYFTDSLPPIAMTDSVKLKFSLSITPSPIITKVFFKELEQLDSIFIQANFDAQTKNINAKLQLPNATYQGIVIDSLAIAVIGDAKDLKFSVGFESIKTDPIHIKKTILSGVFNDNKLLLDFNAFNKEQQLIRISSEAVVKNDTLKLHINPSNLILNTQKWNIPEDNKMILAEKYLNFNAFTFSRNSQKIAISNDIAGIAKKHLGITFQNFNLEDFVSILNPDETLASGIVNGNFIVEDVYGASGIIADFNIENLEALRNELGNLSINAVSESANSYDFDLALKDAGINLNLTGDYAAAATGAELNLDLDLEKIELRAIEKFSNGSLKNSEGYISGNIAVSGTTKQPKYDGTIQFNETIFNVARLNSVFKISNESIKINNKGIYFDTFTIADTNNSNFNLSGNILTESLINPSFNLTLNTEKFQVLNSTAEDNELFYGKASINADLSIKGNLKLPKVSGRLRIRKVTDITYVVPESQLDLQERDGVVIFVNRENPDNILTRKDDEEKLPFFKGFDVNTILEIADDAKLNVIIDKKTGDNLAVSGDASLNLNIASNGRINLSGRYELNSGHYETNLYNLVSRRFEIKSGSTITWQGDPRDAKLDVTAIYKVETSASPLMSSVTSGQDLNQTKKYQQVLPFLVYLNVDGELLEPQLSFGLDMPEDEQGSLGGAVYGRVQQLNQQEAQVNKQVFSLLALNRFFPDAGSDGSSGGTAAIARDNVNRVLADQLNIFSNDLLGSSGFDLDFDLDSFTDYQGEAPQDRTQLNINAKKKLFEDRLIVGAGSSVDVEGSAQAGQEQTPIIGNVSLEYLLTKDGRYRLRGFRKNEYENIIDGQLIVTGVALIFNREFNKFSQLFNPLKDNDGKEKVEDKKNTQIK
jgi:hypothetical protein